MASEPEKFRVDEPDKDYAAADSADPNVIRIRVDNVKDLTKEGIKSEIKRIDGFPWQSRVFLNDDFVRVEVECKKSEECELWECEADFNMKLINHDFDYLSASKKRSNVFCSLMPTHCLKIVHLDSVLGDKGFVIDGSILLETTIIVTDGNEERFRKRIRHNFFAPTKFSDAILYVEGKKFHVSKQILAHASPYFEALFFGSFKESKEKKFTLDDVSAKCFLIILELVYGPGNYDGALIDDDNVEDLLMIADRYDIPKIMISCEEWLIYSSVLPNHPLKLRLSDQYSLYVLQIQCLRRLTKDGIAEIINSDPYKQFSRGLKDLINEKLHDFNATNGFPRTMSDGRTFKDSREIHSGLIQLRGQSIEELEQGGVLRSEEKRINGFPWSITVIRHNSDQLEGTVECKKTRESPLWECQVEGKIKLINHNDETASICKNFEFLRDHLCMDRSFNICKWDQIIGDQGFVFDGGIDVDVVISVKGRSGDRFRTIAHTDFDSPSKFSDVVFCVDGVRMHASKHILANASRFFRKAFSGESDEMEIFLDDINGMEDISAREFREMIEMIDDSRGQFDNSNVELLLRMAKQLEITDFLDRAESWLLYGVSFPTHKKLLLADQYNLNALKGDCLRDISNYKKIEELKNSKSYNHYSSELKDELFTKLLQFCKDLEER